MSLKMSPTSVKEQKLRMQDADSPGQLAVSAVRAVNGAVPRTGLRRSSQSRLLVLGGSPPLFGSTKCTAQQSPSLPQQRRRF